MSSKPFHIGVMLEAVQLADTVGIDILGSLSQDCIKASLALGAVSPSLLDSAHDITFHCIASSLEP
jgi:hypothetical protein